MTTGIKGPGMATETRTETRGQIMIGGGRIMETETGGQTTTFVTETDLKIIQETGGPPQTGEGTLTATTLIPFQ